MMLCPSMRAPVAVSPPSSRPRMQTAALVSVMTALTLALAALPKEDGSMKKEKLKTDSAVYESLDLDNYDLNLDNYGEVIDLSNYEEIYDYGGLASKIEVGTLAPPTKSLAEPQSTTSLPTETPQKNPPTPTAARPKGPGLFGSITDQGLPTCLVCVCISTSVYCDDTDLEHILPLPLETTYFYARFNRISRIEANDFIGLTKLQRIDLTSNSISWVDEDSFRLLPSLQELILPENKLTSLPELPGGIVQLDARLNMIQSAGIRPEAFEDLKKLQFLHLSDNKLDYIPVPLPEGLRSLHLQNNNIQTLHRDTFCDSRDHSHIRRALEDIRLDGNPINLSLFPDAYFCLPRLPTGRFY
ncbi:opticin isoform X2 [Hemicordylus capensis]|uniref:opticin isoform X2 n=1 Tax=Hemicordylus capensis TaxID=884348 RepID=UPI002304B6FA|nr:opticin isoform X2 [Hemicordylus capensis]